MTIRVIRKHKQSSIKKGSTTDRKTYDVLVLATMSAGKSSFINALVGRELLPSANEATTACLTSIAHRRSGKNFRGSCFSREGVKLSAQADASIDQVRAWNADPDVKHIQLFGKFGGRPAIPPGLVLHDTPGPNNSQDERHAELMLEAIRTVPFRLVCYVLNAGQLGTWDDRRLLEAVREQLAGQAGRQLVFILNKVDLLDPERGEDIPDCVDKARRYLEGLGFTHPIIVPTMAHLALCARKAMRDQPLTRVERMKLRQALDELAAEPDHILHATLPEATRLRALKDIRKASKPRSAASEDAHTGDLAELEQLLVRSGISTVEFLINQRNKFD